ncbi:signal peptidase I [Ruminiclostridium cellulolyticum]|uniref:Signal peptidase I n=1 Tax=Ruminiclostridium cellulolyticum (strain ATCC 35319 / DSM 5812 / JCM 6584 / H10) TaxID=394503 RepID=B8I7T7_RUMCH|nr:signal peptidase I [Ruminiclostridium cellulolyticum]ACL75094.1 signal peptidase I [Ruminiclostridium cellulolyticum H10]
MENRNIDDKDQSNLENVNEENNVEGSVSENIKEESATAKKKNSVGREIFEWFLVIVAALVISMVIKAFVFSTYKVNMVSMENTLYEGHNVIVYKTGYFFSQPKHEQIIVFTHEEGQFKGLLKYLPVANPGEVDYIKRVIGLPGDEIDIRDGYVWRKSSGDKDFIKLDEPYARGLTDSHGMQLPYKVPEDKLFVMGDNREQSLDSRQIGPVDIDSVIGHAVLRIWPFSKFGGLK